MDRYVAAAVGQQISDMKSAREELARRGGYLSTPEALELAPFELSEETLLSYPEFICPRTRKNPNSKRSALLWDPRDVLALPLVLRQWHHAIELGQESGFVAERERLLAERDRLALERILGVAA